MIHKKYLCPICLGQQILTFDAIKTYIVDEYSDLIGKNAMVYDSKILRLSKHIASSYNDKDVPELAGYLNQDAIFALSQLIVTNLISAT